MTSSRQLQPDTSPCVAHACSACCQDTGMTLTRADVARLHAAGHRDFFGQTAEGMLQLMNVAGRCRFLDDHGCTVYAARPQGCRLYPLILDLDQNLPVRDDFCPHRAEFRFSVEDERLLRESVEIEFREAAQHQEQPFEPDSPGSL